ncbi:MAG: mechanosensitive ion channel [Clostridia bacterium]|nr:mechanosensitive ion channel [Clostridia bacterium]
MDFIKEGFDAIKGSIVESGLKVIVAIIILFVGLKIINFIVKRIHKALEKKKVDTTIIQFSESLSSIALKIGLILAILTTVGFEVTSFVAVLGAASFAVGLALQGSLSNFAAGVIILILRPIRIGDYVEMAGTAGIVSSIKVFSTILNTPDNKTIIIPNSSIIASNIVNYSLEPQRRVDFVFGVEYNSDIKQVKELLVEVASAHEKVLKDKDIFVGLSELADSSINFVLRVWVNSPDYWTVHFDLMEQIKNALDQANIGIPYPHIQVVK